jgi:hypothetical protein
MNATSRPPARCNLIGYTVSAPARGDAGGSVPAAAGGRALLATPPHSRPRARTQCNLLGYTVAGEVDFGIDLGGAA